MKHLKMLGLFVMAAASLMAFAGSASAATFTAPTGTEYTGHIEATLEGGSATLHAGFADVTCTESIITGQITTNNEEHASGTISTVDFSNCGSFTVTTLNHKGTLTIRKSDTTVTGTGVEVTVSALGTSCVYGMGTGTDMGKATNTTYKDAGVTRDRVTLGIGGSHGGGLLPKISGGFLCASPAEWTAGYLVTSPTESFVH